MKEMKLDPNPFSLRKNSGVLTKVLLSVLLLGISFRLFSNTSPTLSTVSPPPNSFSQVSELSPRPEKRSESGGGDRSDNPAKDSLQTNPDAASDSDDENIENADSVQPEAKCDIFSGEWVPNPSGPAYDNESCPLVEAHQNCMKNGRPDDGYLYWRWKPRDCDLPAFDARVFLHLMKNKSWAFIGDSISRNHVQSLVCILSKVERAVEIYHDKEYRSKKWLFPSHNITVAVIWSPFLLKADIFEDMNGVSTKEIQLHLDALDENWTSEYKNFDYIITAVGKWFLKTAIYWENNTIAGCHYCPGKNLTELGFEYAYSKALRLVFNQIITSGYKGVVLLRTSTPDHFENGEWFSGGTCDRKAPLKDSVNITLADVDRILREIELEEFESARVLGIENGVTVKLLDTTRLSLLRPDGHPGPYRQFQPFAVNKTAKVQNDCLHWCLPGPIDSWNDLIMRMVLGD